MDRAASPLYLLTSRPFTKIERLWVLRSALAPVTALRWTRFIGDLYARYVGTAPETAVLLLPLRSYGRKGLSPRKRTELMMHHHTRMEELFTADLNMAVHRQNDIDLVALEGKGSQFRIVLNNSAKMLMLREGELVLSFQRVPDGLILAKVCMLLDTANGQPILAITGNQGAPGAKTAIIAATRKLHGLRPKDALLLAARAMAQALGVDEVQAISNDSHVIAQGNEGKRHTDLDGHWIERGAEVAQPYGFKFPAAVDLGEGAKTRDAIKRQIVETVRSVIEGYRIKAG